MKRIRAAKVGRALVACSVALLTLPSACTTFEPIFPRTSISHPWVEARFTRPIDLVGRRRDGEQVVRRQVRWLAGRPLAIRNDSLVLEVGRWISGDRGERESRPFVAAIPTGAVDVDLGTRHLSGARTVAAILAVPVVAWILLWILCESGHCPFPDT